MNNSNNLFSRVHRKVKSLQYHRHFPYSPTSNKLRAIFIHIPKAAGTSVRLAMGEARSGRRHLPWWVYKEANQKKFDEYYKFSFVRDPTDRTISGYNYLRAGGNNKDDLAASEKIKSYRSFEHFLEEGLLNGFLINHTIFRPQWWYLCEWSGNLKVDFLGHYETLDDDFEHIAHTIGIPEKLPITNSTHKRHSEDLTASDTAKQLIRKIYAQDYKLFNYE